MKIYFTKNVCVYVCMCIINCVIHDYYNFFIEIITEFIAWCGKMKVKIMEMKSKDRGRARETKNLMCKFEKYFIPF